MKRCFTSVFLVLVFVCSASAQSDWVAEFLHRYRAPAIDPASRVTPPVSDESWRLLVREGVLPLGVGDVIRLMLQNNLDVTVNRFSPLTSGYSIEMLSQT